MPCQETAIEHLRDSRVRLTPQRAMVLDAIYHSDGHLTADEVYELVRCQSSFVELSTVYRTLFFLKQRGVIGELRLDGQPVRYEAVRRGQEHHHVVCTACGRILEVDSDDLQSLSVPLEEKYGFRVNLVHLTLSGLCRECRESIGKEG